MGEMYKQVEIMLKIRFLRWTMVYGQSEKAPLEGSA